MTRTLFGFLRNVVLIEELFKPDSCSIKDYLRIKKTVKKRRLLLNKFDQWLSNKHHQQDQVKY